MPRQCLTLLAALSLLCPWSASADDPIPQGSKQTWAEAEGEPTERKATEEQLRNRALLRSRGARQEADEQAEREALEKNQREARHTGPQVRPRAVQSAHPQAKETARPPDDQTLLHMQRQNAQQAAQRSQHPGQSLTQHQAQLRAQQMQQAGQRARLERQPVATVNRKRKN